MKTKIKCRDCGKDLTKGSGTKRWDRFNKSVWPNQKEKWLCAKCHKTYIVGSFFIPISTLNKCDKKVRQ